MLAFVCLDKKALRKRPSGMWEVCIGDPNGLLGRGRGKSGGDSCSA